MGVFALPAGADANCASKGKLTLSQEIGPVSHSGHIYYGESAPAAMPWPSNVLFDASRASFRVFGRSKVWNLPTWLPLVASYMPPLTGSAACTSAWKVRHDNGCLVYIIDQINSFFR